MKKILLTICALLVIAAPCFATVISFQQGVDSYTGTTDTYMRGGSSATTNFDTGELIVKDEADGEYSRVTIIKFDISAIPAGSTINSVTLTLKLYANDAAATATLYLYECLRNWVEAQATWNIYSTGNNWGTAGARQDTTDMTGTFGTATGALSSVSIPSGTSSGDITLPTSSAFVTYITNNIGGSVNFVLHQAVDAGTRWDFYDSENATASNHPVLNVDYGEYVPPTPQTYYVRTDGGTATECDGKTDHALAGASGTNCAFNHPNWVIPLEGQSTTHQLAAEDTVIIGPGQYQIGCWNYPTTCLSADHNITETATCYPNWAYDCNPSPITSGTDSTHKTKVYGAGWDTGCVNPPQFYGVNGIYNGIDLTDSSNVDIRCLEFTDHSDAADVNQILYAEDSSNVYLKDLNLHGGTTGIHAGRLTDWTLENVKINMNHSAGWDGDITGADSNSGTMTFNNVEITYNGCYEDYSTGLPMDCCSQDQGCYGDGLGTGSTKGTWNFTDCNISHNTSDGLDLLYSDADTVVNVYRSLMEGNAGNQLKIPNRAHVENSLIIGNCGYFYGQSFTRGGSPAFNHCRAAGNTIELAFNSNTVPEIYNNTVLGNGDVLIDTSGTCTTGTDVSVKNNIMYGGRERNDDTTYNGAGGNDSVSIYYDAAEKTCNTDFVEDYNICYAFKEGSSACNGAHSTDTVDPLFTGTIQQGPAPTPGYYSGDDYLDQLYISSSSTARDAADETVSASAYDYNNFARGASWDIGGYEYGSTTETVNFTLKGCTLYGFHQ